jgi:hypothetical protein
VDLSAKRRRALSFFRIFLRPGNAQILFSENPIGASLFKRDDDVHAIHGSYEVKNLGKPVSHGCVRISPQNATTLYALVEKNGLDNTQVVLNGVTPGGEFKFATQHDTIYYDKNIDPIFVDDTAQHEAD